MSIIIRGDGSITSSIYFSALVLPNPTQNPRRIIDNIDLLEGDGGWEWTYEKGTYRRSFLYRFRLLTETQKFSIEKEFLEVVKGRLHWFMLNPHGQAIVDSFLQQHAGSTTIIQHSSLNQEDNYWKGFWVFALSGSAQGQKRKAISSDQSSTQIIVEAFDNTVSSGDSLIIGYPVRLDDLPIFNPRKPNFWDMDLSFIEKVMS